VLTIRAAAKLLAAADSAAALHPIAHALGFTAPPTPLSTNRPRTAPLAPLLLQGALVTTPATPLTLLAAITAPPTTLDTTTPHATTLTLARTLLRIAPTRLWCLLTLDHTRHHLTIATLLGTPSAPRVAALHLHRLHVVDSDADTLRALATTTQHEPDATLRHARFSDILRRDHLSGRFYRALATTVDTLANSATPTPRTRTTPHPASPDDRHTLALLCASRCLFLAFLEAKGWLDHRHDFLLHHTTRLLESGGRLHDRLLHPLCFGTLNTPRTKRAPAARTFGAIPFLNGGLFSPTPLEARHRALRFSDEALTTLLAGLLDRFRFTAREDSTSWSEAAVDPEMLGRAFEGLMHPDTRRRTGAFYTPPTLVALAVQEALAHALPTLPLPTPGTTPHPPLTPAQRDRILALRILDPACGSGAFLVHTLETLADTLALGGDPRPRHELRRTLLVHSIFGVDRNPMAVWLCELRLWLSVLIDHPATTPRHIPPLPNLDHNIRTGDALAGGTFLHAPHDAHTLATLRERYTRATGTRKRALAATLDHEERRHAITVATRQLDTLHAQRRTLLHALRSPNLFGERRPPTRTTTRLLRHLRTAARELTTTRSSLQLGAALPFRFASAFPDIARLGGFSLIVGNPPWVRPHALPTTERARLKHDFLTLRHAPWRTGATAAGAAAGFAAQGDLAAAFLERAVHLLAPTGTLALLLPAKLWRTLSGGGTRLFLTTHTTPVALHDWSDAPPLFDAATYPSLLVATRLPTTPTTSPPTSPTTPPPTPPTTPPTTPPATPPHPNPNPATTRIALARGPHTTHFHLPTTALPLDHDPAAPWILLPPHARHAFDLLRHAGPPLAHTPLGRPTLGVKTGCNAAFLVHSTEPNPDLHPEHRPHHDHLATITPAVSSAPPRSASIERHQLRPTLRGEDIARPTPAPLHLVWTHDHTHHPLRTLPPLTARWLAPWRPTLERRHDARARLPWWALFRTHAARHDTPRLVWADIGRSLRLQLLPAGDPTVPLNSCYVLPCRSHEEALALLALLHSPLTTAWLHTLAEPARGGFKRFLGWTLATLPVPTSARWPTATRLLAPLGHTLADGHHVPDDLLLDTAAAAYGIPLAPLTPLLSWIHSP
jgi:hypothetical protein